MGTKYSSLTKREREVIPLAAQGLSTRAIAATLGDCGHVTVSKINKKHKELIEAQAAKLVEGMLADSIDRAVREVKAAKKLTDDQLFDKENQEALKRIDKKEEMMLKSVGIAPSHAPSFHVQQIFNDNRKTLLTPEVANLLHNKFDYSDSEDAEYDDIE